MVSLPLILNVVVSIVSGTGSDTGTGPLLTDKSIEWKLILTARLSLIITYLRRNRQEVS